MRAYRSCYRQLIDILPIDHDLVEIDQLPGDLKDRIKTERTKAAKVKCLLDDLEGGIRAGYTERFDQLILACNEGICY